MADLNGWDLDHYRALLHQRGLRMQVDRRIVVRFDQSDLANETILHAVEAKQAPPVSAPEGVKIRWFYTIQDRILSDRYRYEFADKRDAARDRNFQQGLSDSAEAEMAQFAAPDTGPVAQAINNETDAQLEAALQQLPPERAEVLRRKAGGETFQEIADDLGVPLSTLTSRYYEDMDRLYQLLGSEET